MRFESTILIVSPEVRAFVREVLAERHPDPIEILLLADVQPRASGVELARRLAAHRPGLTIVLIPADPEAPLLHELGGPDGPFVLEKPFTPEALAAKVRGALDAPRTHIRT